MKTKVALTLFSFVMISGLLLSNVVFADIAPPKKQMRSDISQEDIICDEGFVKLTKSTTGTISCVKPSTAENLIKRGWAEPVDQKIIDAAKMQKESIGTVNKLAVVKVTGSAGIQTPKVPIIGYDFVFEVCAMSKTIYAPDILVKSDSAAQHVELATSIDANTCQVSSTIVKAANPETITVTLLNKGGISENIAMLESKIADISNQLSSEKQKLNTLVRQEPKSADFRTMVSESNKKINQLKTELNEARADYSRFLFVLYASPSKSSAPTKFTFSGVPIEGASATKLAVTQQVTGEGFNVVFEACAGEKAVIAPMVTVKSDIESKNVVLANRISPNTCQLGTGQLKANDQNLIQVVLDNTEAFSAKVAELEANIAKWQGELATEKRNLAELVKIAQKPADYEMKVTEFTNKIIELRNLINNAKSSLQGSLLDFYK